jgi:hypothetical protein
MNDDEGSTQADHDDERATERPSNGADEGHSPGGGGDGGTEEPGPLGNPDVDEEAQSQGQQDE